MAAESRDGTERRRGESWLTTHGARSPQFFGAVALLCFLGATTATAFS
jgi:hypothetical protein